MASDYAQIRADNIRAYGDEDGHLELLGMLYADRTHCLFELLQNAEDARATWVEVDVFEDRIEVAHDGRLFDEADVRGICGVRRSTKLEDATKIGRFGLGFKSVYAYTTTPQVHSGDEHFEIEHFVRPSAIPTPVAFDPAHTRFVIPFNRDDVTAHEAADELAAALAELQPATLLFLTSLTRITARRCGERLCELTVVQEQELDGGALLVGVGTGLEGHEPERFLLWARNLEALGVPEQAVEVAFKVVGDDGAYAVEPLVASPLVVWFPTEKETFLGFLVQGPFHTTPARDNIPSADPWNKALVGQVAELMADALAGLRQLSMLDGAVLDCLPVQPSRFEHGSLFAPLREASIELLREQPLLSASDGTPLRGRDALIARTAALVSLLGPSQLRDLYDGEGGKRWLSPELLSGGSPAASELLRLAVGIPVITPKDVVERLDGDFLEAQPDAWLNELYRLLVANEALWRSGPLGSRGAPLVALSRPIIRLESGRHVEPFDDVGRPKAYLPANRPTPYPTVRGAVAADERSCEFLRQLGIREPDKVDELVEHVLPLYEASVVPTDDRERHLTLIADALDDADRDGRGRLLLAVAQTSLIRTEAADGSGERWLPPPGLYWPSPELREFFKGCPGINLVAPGYERWKDLLCTFGVATHPELRARMPGAGGHVVLASSWGHHERALDGFDPDAMVIGLEHALDAPSLGRARFVWNEVLVPHSSLLRGVVELAPRQNFTGSRREERRSRLGQICAERSWLPGPDGAWHVPSELALEDLPDGFRRDRDVAAALGMRTAALSDAARGLQVDEAALRFLVDNQDAVLELMEKQAEQAPRRGVGSLGGATHVDVRAELESRFARQGPLSDALGGLVLDNPLIDSNGRRARVQGEIAERREAAACGRPRFRQVARKVWDAKDGLARAFLAVEYGGRCQVCSSTFLRRDGTPYFEGVYLVSHTAAEWLDRPGNVLCLCPTCSAKFRHGSVEAATFVDEVVACCIEGRPTQGFAIELCGQPVSLRFTARHLLDLQEVIRAGGTPA